MPIAKELHTYFGKALWFADPSDLYLIYHINEGNRVRFIGRQVYTLQISVGDIAVRNGNNSNLFTLLIRDANPAFSTVGQSCMKRVWLVYANQLYL